MGASQETGIIDLDVPPPEDADGGRLRWHPRHWPRPVLIAVTAVVTILATLLTVRAAEGTGRATVAVEEPRPPSSPWAELYGSAILKLDEAGTRVFDGINAVDSGLSLASVLEPGDYRLRFACASEVGGMQVDILVRGVTGDVLATRADCDQEHTDAAFRVDESLSVSVWVGSHQEAQTAYAFAVVAE